MADPSSLVPQALLRHIHLVSSYQFPSLPSFNLDVVVEYLIQAQSVVREQAPMNWMFLQCPQDGDVLLVWQPPQMGTQEASDGYVWADPESAFSSEMRGYKVEMYVHKTGFRMPNEPMATHARRRLRLTSSRNPDPSIPQPDSSLWIIYYCQTEPQSQYPSRNIRISDQVRQQMNERMQLQRHGQLVRKEFMLRDSASWPTINLPGNPNPSYAQQAMGYPNDVMAHMNRSQQQAYIQQQQATMSQRGVGPSPAKRPRHGGSANGHGSSTAIPAPVVPQNAASELDDEKLSGDYMDHVTPRDISLHRYIQHHEWLEEILESPYDTNQIIPGELGLGRKGELESLTKDFFDAPTDATPREGWAKEATPIPRIGRLGAGKAEEFTRRATEKVAEINAEMEKLKKKHARRMMKLHKGRALKDVAENLRMETLEMMNGDTGKLGAERDHNFDEIAMKLVGKSIKAIPDVECIDKGGLEENRETKDSADHDYDMVDNINLDGAQPPAPTASEQQGPDPTYDMSSRPSEVPRSETVGLETSDGDAVGTDGRRTPAQPRKDSAAEDWIMVNKEGNSAPEDQDIGDLDSFGNDTSMQPNMDTPSAIENAGDDVLQVFEQGAEDNEGDFAQGAEEDAADFQTNAFGEGIDFGGLDTAGDELAGYTEEIENTELDEPGDMGTNDNGFGDAFQDTEASAAAHGEPAAGS